MSTHERSDTFFQALLQGLDRALLAVDASGRILYLNPSAERVTGWKASAVLGKNCAELVDCDGCGDPCSMLRSRGDERLMDLADGSTMTFQWAGEVKGATGKVAVTLLSLHRPASVKTERISLSEMTADADPLRDLVGRSAAIRRIADTIRRLARSEAAVLITGESGTGKEVVARALHATSPRAQGPFVALNCAALVEGLVESELFGHVRGAFTGAVRDRPGAVEVAAGGTFFLDEIGDLDLGLQAKLLRLLQERTFQRVGETKTRKADIRIIAATNVDLEQAVEEGRFRQDLYYRLSVIPLHIPPLRERPEDVAPLARYHLARRSVASGRLPMRFAPSAMQRLEAYHWPGNVRELVNVVDYVVALAPETTVTVDDLPEQVREVKPQVQRRRGRGRYMAPSQDREEERKRIEEALQRHGYHRQRTADALGMDRVTLYRKIKELGIEVPR